MEDPGMEGIRIALLAMQERKKQLYNPYSFVDRSELDPDMRDLENRQRDNEILAVDAEVARYQEELVKTAERGDGSSLPLGRRLLQGFYEPLTAAIDAEQELIRLKIPGVDRINYGSFFLMLHPDKLAVITLHVVISELMKGTEAFTPDQPQAGMVKFVRVVERLGEAVQAEVNLARMRKRARAQKDADQERNEEMRGVRDLAEDVADIEVGAAYTFNSVDP
jgi:DNA-directed RNA polymerase